MEATTASAAPAGGTRRDLLGLAVLGLPTLLIALDNSVLYLVLPRLSEDLRAGATEQLWIADMSVFMMAGLLVTAGALGDRIGRRRLLLLGSACLGAVSVPAAYAVDPAMLIACRALVGAASAALVPSIMGLIRIMFPDARRHACAIALWMGCYVGGTALGPVAAGTLLDAFWWGSVFLLNLPVTLVLLVLGPRLLPEYRDPSAGRLHLPSVLLSLGAVLPVTYGLKELARDGAGTAPLLAVAAGTASAALFVRLQRSLADPLLDVRLLRIRALGSAVSLTAVAGVLSGIQLFVSLYLQTVEAMSPLRTAVWLLPSTLATVLAVQATPLLTRWIRPGFVIAGGLVIVAAGHLVLVPIHDAGQRALLMAGLVVSSLGIGPLSALCAHLVLRSAPPDRAGSAASLNETCGQLGMAMGIAVLGVLGNAVYQGRMGVLPPGIPADAAAAARDSVVGAATATAELPRPVADRLVAQADAALAHGLAGVAAACGAIAAAAALVAAVALRHVPPTAGTADEPVPRADEPAADAAGSPATDRTPTAEGNLH
ncbi:MFS transporter [Actinomadura nitritigenes]|uniref:MFS transporter n=1 Tax=Actinomadura nitritigenes TaxID=134602 RepID=UPI003D8F10C8